MRYQQLSLSKYSALRTTILSIRCPGCLSYQICFYYIIFSSFSRMNSDFSFSPIFPVLRKIIFGFDGLSFTAPADSAISLRTLFTDISET